MKILHVINSLSMGGAERLVADLAPLQRERGHEVEVLLLRGGETPFRKMLDDAGIRVVDFGTGTSVYSPLNIFRIIPYLRKYDVVHVHLFPAQYWVALAKILSFSKVKLVTTEHSTHNRRRDIRFFRSIDRFIYRCYTFVACCSDIVEKSLVVYLGYRERICSVPNGVDINKIVSSRTALPEEFSIPRGAFLLLQVARFAYPKDQGTVIRSLTLLPEQVHAVFVGDGENRNENVEFVQRLGLQSRVHFLGIRRNIPELLKMADVVVCSSEYEGLSLASVEGLASTKPVIASDVPGLAEVVGGAGILFPKGDENALAQAVLRLMTDKSHYAQVADACFRRAEAFDIRKMCDAYLALYAQ